MRNIVRIVCCSSVMEYRITVNIHATWKVASETVGPSPLPWKPCSLPPSRKENESICMGTICCLAHKKVCLFRTAFYVRKKSTCIRVDGVVMKGENTEWQYKTQGQLTFFFKEFEETLFCNSTGNYLMKFRSRQNSIPCSFQHPKRALTIGNFLKICNFHFE